MVSNTIARLLGAMHFAARKHANQRRKNAEAYPYINHLIEVTELVAAVGKITDETILLAAVLHDTLEDTDTTREELDELFGAGVRRLVEEVTDDKSLPKEERKRLQIAHAPHLSKRARPIKIADKISNVRAVTHTPPATWSHERKREYLDWTERVIDGLRGFNPALEKLYDETLAEGRKRLRKEERGGNSKSQIPKHK